MKSSEQQRNLEKLKKLLTLKEAEGYEIKEISDKGDVMGCLMGCQFDSNARGGYVYFWSSGIVGRQLLDYETGEEIIEDATSEMSEEEIQNLLDELESKL